MIDGGEVSGEHLADGKMVNVRGTVKVVSLGDSPEGGHFHLRAAATVVEGTLDAAGAGYAGGGGGAGGGILLYCGGNSGIVISGSVKTLGGGGLADNGGTVKIRYAGQKPEGDIQAGRVHYLEINGKGCEAGCPGNQICDEGTGLCLEAAICVDDVDCLGNRICKDEVCQEPEEPKEPPSLTILHPPSGYSTSDDFVDVSGTATDDTGVSEVDYRVNGGLWAVCSGTSNWTCSQISWLKGATTSRCAPGTRMKWRPPPR